MKILIVNFVYWPDVDGGSQISTRLLAEKLAENGHTVFVLTTDKKEYQSYHNGVYIYYLKIPSWFHYPTNLLTKIGRHLLNIYNPFLKRKILDVLKTTAPDIIHTNCIQYFSSVIWELSNRLQIPVIHTVRDYYLICIHGMVNKNGRLCTSSCLACSICSALRRNSARTVTTLVAISQYMMEKHCERHLFKTNINKFVIYNCAPDDLNQQNVKKSCRTIGFIGRICKEKGIELLVSSFCNIQRNDIKLMIAGNGDMRYINTLKRQYPDPRIIWMGRIQQNEFYKEIDLLVVPSLWPEPFGRVVVEAIKANRPVLASNRGGMPEILRAIPFGAIFEIENPHSLQEKLESIIINPALYHSFFNIRKNMLPFDNSFISSQYEQIYHKTLKAFKEQRKSL